MSGRRFCDIYLEKCLSQKIECLAHRFGFGRFGISSITLTRTQSCVISKHQNPLNLNLQPFNSLNLRHLILNLHAKHQYIYISKSSIFNPMGFCDFFSLFLFINFLFSYFYIHYFKF